KSAQIREILISESAWEEMTCLFAPSLAKAKKSAQKILEKNPFLLYCLCGLCLFQDNGLSPVKRWGK
ncbi:hypothetical protein OH884_26120, partial [Klebsiella quasipneumoniae]|nr:hypothetical protein [Klebsiella quasipneumoniae]MEE2208010.1 hypothetical protein [Klebsiella pneumoniae]